MRKTSASVPPRQSQSSRAARAERVRAASVALAAMVLAGALTACDDSASESDPPGSPDRPQRNAGQYPVRGVYDGDPRPQRALGFNLIDSPPSPRKMDDLARRGLRGFVWLGGYSNETCSFNEDDGWVRARVRSIARHRAVGAYLIDDEPDAARCPEAPQQMRKRSEIVKSIDRRVPTFLASYKVEQFRRFAGTVDVLALDRYACTKKDGCDYSKIDDAAAEANRLGVRYWAVIQAHGDDWYKQPTPGELHRQFEAWRRTRMEGYLVFGWRWPRERPSGWLKNNPALRAQLRHENSLGRARARATRSPDDAASHEGDAHRSVRARRLNSRTSARVGNEK